MHFFSQVIILSVLITYSLDCVLLSVRRKLMLVTLGTYRVNQGGSSQWGLWPRFVKRWLRLTKD